MNQPERPAVVARVKNGELVFGKVLFCKDFVSCPDTAIAKLLRGDTIRLQEYAPLFNVVQRTVEAALDKAHLQVQQEAKVQKTKPQRKRPLRKTNAYQTSVLSFVRSFWAEKGYSPTLREIADACDINSTSVIAYTLDALEARGLLKRQLSISRSIVLTKQVDGEAA